MKLLLFSTLLVIWRCILAHNEFDKYKNGDDFVENNAAEVSPDEAKENPSELDENAEKVLVGTDSIETYITYTDAEVVESNVEDTTVKTKRQLLERTGEQDDQGNVYNKGYNVAVEIDARMSQEIEGQSQIVNGEKRGLIEDDLINSESIYDIDLTENLVQRESDFSKETNDILKDDGEGLSLVDREKYKSEPMGILVQDGLDQYDNTDKVGKHVKYSPVEMGQDLTEVVDVKGDLQQDRSGTETVATDFISNTETENKDRDFIEMFGLPETLVTSQLRSTVRYRAAGPRILLFDIFAIGVDHMRSIFHTEWTEMLHYAGKVKEKVLLVDLPDNLVYKENKFLRIYPDLHSNSLLVRSFVVDYNNPTVLLVNAEHSIKLIPPWSRMPKYSKRSCKSWFGAFIENLSKNSIPKCPKINDIVELLSFPVALVGSEHGYYKSCFQTLNEADDFVGEVPKFTLATWLYLTKRCSNDMCPLLYRMKGTAFQTPLIGLLKSGHLHLQFHYIDGTGYAFLVDSQIPIHEWVHITVTIKNTVVSVYVRHGKHLQNVKTFLHSDFPAGLYHYNDTDGHWGVGGSPGFISTHGFIGPARIYRRKILSLETIKTIFTAASKPALGIASHFKSCGKLKSAVKFMLRKESKTTKLCTSKYLIKNFCEKNYCGLGTRGLATEIVHALNSSDMMQHEIYGYVFNLIKTNKKNVKDALLLLSYTSCLGHPQSLYLASVLYRTGLGVNMNQTTALKFLLLGSYYNHPLSQMSLAYKHYTGVDDLPKDLEVASTYYRYAAVQSNRILVEHNEVDTHSEAVRLDKKEDLDNYRGLNSNWFSWLKHQANRGVTDAQSALGEVFYYGLRGFRRNLTRAAEFYEMGANRGDAQMLFNLGVVKLRGQGVAMNTEEAQVLLKKAAELGFAPAYNALGYYELNVRDNKSGAVEYFRLAAQQEDRDGLYNLGFALESGLTPGTAGDLQSAVPYYVSAANKGHTGACVVAGYVFSLGLYVELDMKISVVFYKFVADQIPEIGLHLRSGLDAYFEGAWYQSLLHYILAAEAGMEIAQYNTALLCEWNFEKMSEHTQVDCAWRYYNHSAKLEWVPSLVKTGDNHWYGITVDKNITTAAHLYSKAAGKEQNPQAIYNLAYLVENSYPVGELDWMQFLPSSVNTGNLSLAAALYRKCRDTSDEAWIPCSVGLVRVAVKMVWQVKLLRGEVFLIPFALIIIGLAILVFYLCCLLHSHRELTDLA